MTTEKINLIILVTVALCAAASAAMPVIAAVAAKKHLNIGSTLSSVESAAALVQRAAQAASPFLLPAYGGTAVKIAALAKTAAAAAEQLYKTGTVAKEQRFCEAWKFMLTALGAEGVTVNENIRSLVNTALEAAVYGLGHREAGTAAAATAAAGTIPAPSECKADTKTA